MLGIPASDPVFNALEKSRQYLNKNNLTLVGVDIQGQHEPSILDEDISMKISDLSGGEGGFDLP